MDGDGQKQEVGQIGKLNLLQVHQPLTNARRSFPTDAQLTGSTIFSDTVAPIGMWSPGLFGFDASAEIALSARAGEGRGKTYA